MAVFIDAWRHAWRLRLPLVLPLLVLLLLATLPALLAADGTAVGRVLLFRSYGWHLLVFALLCMVTAWAAWLERFERARRVHWILACRPVSRAALLSWRILAHVSLVLVFFGLSALAMHFLSERIRISEVETVGPGDRAAASRLSEVRRMEAMPWITGPEPRPMRLRGVDRLCRVLDPGTTATLALDCSGSAGDTLILGLLVNHHENIPALLHWSIRKDGEVLLRQDLPFTTGVSLRIVVPRALAELSPLQLDLRQSNSRGLPLLAPEEEPFCASRPVGQPWLHLPAAALKFAALALVLVALAVVFAQFLSLQGSVLAVAGVAAAGLWREDLSLLFFGGTGAQRAHGFLSMVGDVLYSLLWHPILFLAPDFRALNPAAQLAGGDWISAADIAGAMASALPLLLVLVLALWWQGRRLEPAPEP